MRSLSYQLKAMGQDTSLVDEAYLANRRQLDRFMERAETEANFDWQGKTVALLGLAFKRDTNDVRNSPSVEIANFLKEKKIARLKAYDPAAAQWFQTLFSDERYIEYYDSESEAVEDADVIIVATDGHNSGRR